MATDNPKISLYVPQQIYDRFKEFTTERDLTMSQAGIAILAEYFGLQEETRKNVVGGVTLEAFQELKEELKVLQELREELKSLKERVNYLETQNSPLKNSIKVELAPTISEPQNNNSKNNVDQESEGTGEDKQYEEYKENSNLQLNLLSELKEIKLEAKHLALRLAGSDPKVSSRQIASKAGTIMKKESTKEFIDWTQQRDPSNVGWDIWKNPDGRKNRVGYPLYYYVPHNPSKEQIESLREWLDNNSLPETPSTAVKNIEANDSQSQKPRRGRRGAKRNGEG